jgi:cell division protein FtsB
VNRWEIIYKASWVALAVLSVIAAICMLVPKFRLCDNLQTKRVEMQAEVDKIESQVKELKDKQERFTSDPQFVERTAKEMGLVKTNETLIKFTNKQTTVFGVTE